MPAVIFDLDDTLYPHVQHVHSGFAAVATYVDRLFNVPAKDVYATLRVARDLGDRGREFQKICQVYRLDVAIMPDLVREYRAHRPQLWLRHDASAALRALRDAGWRTALLTNGDPAVQSAKVRVLGLESLVDHVVYADDYAPGGKPLPEPFIEALRRLQVGPDEAVMVGDDPVNDIEGARALGIRTIVLARTARPHHDGADAVVRLLSEVPAVAAGLLLRRMAHAA